MNIVAHNLIAMNSQRQFGINTGSKAKITEKLSSGYKINRASDDAAGLAISEKMRRLIRGLQQGVENTQDGVSLCQVADGALVEVTEMLQRITELSVKSANGTNADKDREYIQEEVMQILEEINRISDTTSFNERRIFNDSPVSDSLNSNTGVYSYKASVTGQPTDGTNLNYTFLASADGVSVNGMNYLWDDVIDSNGKSITSLDNGIYSLNYNGTKISFAVDNCTDFQEIMTSINKTEIVGKLHDYSQPSIANISSSAIMPFHTLDKDTSLTNDIYNLTTHTLTADEKGIMLDNKYTIAWADVNYMEEATSLKLNFKEKSSSEYGLFISLNLNADHSLKDIISELNGLTFSSENTGYIVTQNIGQQIWKEMDSAGGQTIIKEYSGRFEALSSHGNIYTYYELPAALLQDQGYDVNSVYINKNIYGELSLDLSDASKAKLSFSVDGTKTTDYVLDAESVNKLQTLIDNGGTMQVGQSMDLRFVYQDSEFVYHWEPAKDVSVSELISFYDSKISDVCFYGAFSEKELLTENIDFSQRGQNGIEYSFTTYVDGEVIDKDEDEGENEGWWIQSGVEVGDGMFLKIDKMNLDILGISDLDISTVDGAGYAIDAVKRALQKVTVNRANIGAQQNRLEHIIVNEENIIENTTASESRIRDANMAQEMVKYSNINILEQMGSAMMAQANQSNQSVLSLLE